MDIDNMWPSCTSICDYITIIYFAQILILEQNKLIFFLLLNRGDYCHVLVRVSNEIRAGEREGQGGPCVR